MIEIQATWGVAILGGMFILFPMFVKEPLERWLFHDEPESGPTDPV